MIVIEDLDSDTKIPVEILSYLFDVSETAKVVFEGVPILKVSPETMDQCVPPELQEGVDPECFVERFLGRPLELPYVEGLESTERSARTVWIDHLDDEDESPKLVERLARIISDDEALQACKKRFENVAMGAFLPNGCEEKFVKGPAIFISPQRILNEARALAHNYGLNKAEAYKSLLKAVLLHEAGHAFSFKFSKPPAIGGNSRRFGLRTLEETFAQLFAYTNINEKDRIVMALESKRQSAEYRAWYPLSAGVRGALDWILTIYDLIDKGIISDTRLFDHICIYYLRRCYLECGRLCPGTPLILNCSSSLEIALEIFEETLRDARRYRKARSVLDLVDLLGKALLLIGIVIDPKPRL